MLHHPFIRLALSLLLPLFAAAQVQAASITFNPASLNGSVGIPTSIDLFLQLEDGETLGAFDLYIGFDPDLVAITGYQFGTGLGDDIDLFGTLESNYLFLGYVLFDGTPLSGAGTPMTLATLSLEFLQPGTSSLSFLTGSTLWDESGLADLTTTFDTAQVVAPVPEPSTALLLFAGLAGLAALNRRTGNNRN